MKIPEPRNPKHTEFSKLVMAAVMATYFCGVIIGGAIVINAPDQLGGVSKLSRRSHNCLYRFYAWKAKAENVIKLNREDGGEHGPQW